MKKRFLVLSAMIMAVAMMLSLTSCIKIVVGGDTTGETEKQTEATKPEETKPEETGSEETKPEETEPEASASEGTETEGTKPAAQNYDTKYVAGAYECKKTTGGISDRILSLSENGRYFYEVTFTDGVTGFSIGSYAIIEGKIALCRWFTGGGDPSLEAAPDYQWTCRIDDENGITELSETDGELPFARIQDASTAAAYEASEKVDSAINNLILTNEGPGYFEAVSPAKPGTYYQYSAPDTGSTVGLASESVYFYDDGRFVLEYNYYDGSGHGYGNYVDHNGTILCTYWFMQSGDPVLEAQSGVTTTFTVQDVNTISQAVVFDGPAETLLLTRSESANEAELFAMQFDISETLKHKWLWNNCPYANYSY